MLWSWACDPLSRSDLFSDLRHAMTQTDQVSLLRKGTEA
jgi:hypothetical protein